MSKIITVGFSYCEHVYYFLARYKIINNTTEYHITVMDGTLEKMLYGNHIIKEKNDFLQIEILENNDQENLKSKIAEALSAYLQIPLIRVPAIATGEIKHSILAHN